MTEHATTKLREASSFLQQMIEDERKTAGERKFDHLLSAFLNATRTVDYRLRHKHEETYPTWRKSWNAHLSAAQSQLIKHFVDDRNSEVHESGSAREVKTEQVDISAGYSDRSVTMEVSGPPGAKAYISRPTYTFLIGGTERKVTDACSDYLALLTKMVTEFEAVVRANTSTHKG
jgi:hypothetical protein